MVNIKWPDPKLATRFMREVKTRDGGNSQLKESIRNLQHQHMRMVMLVADKNALARPSHSILVVVLLESS